MQNLPLTSVRRQQGFSLVELLLVLGVIAALAIAAFIVYPNVQAGNQANTERANVDTIVACVKNLYGTTGRYTSLDVDVANQSRCFPATMNGGDYDEGVAINNIWGGAVDIENSTSNADTHFDLTYEDITDNACVKFVPAIAGNYEVVVVNGETLKDDQDLLGAGVISFDPGLVGANCTSGQNLVLVTTR